MSHAISVRFHDQSITVFMHGGSPLVAVKPICENMGIDWRAQRQRIMRHHVMSKGVVIMTTPSAGGEQKTACLPLEMLNGWLFGIDAARVKPDLREKVIRYQRECFHVLAAHFGMLAPQDECPVSSVCFKALDEGISQWAALLKKRGEDVSEELLLQYVILKSGMDQDLVEATQEQVRNAMAVVAEALEGEFIPAPLAGGSGSGQPAAGAGMVLVHRDELSALLRMVELQSERFHLVSQAERDVKHAMQLLSMVSGHVKQAFDSMVQARYQLVDPVAEARSIGGRLRKSLV